MARPSKKTESIKRKLIDLIHRGHTISDACRLTGIGTSTFNRWRNEDLAFNKSVILAGQRQWEYLEETKKLGFRTYKRDWRISPGYDENVRKCQKPTQLVKERDTPKEPLRDYVCGFNPNLFIGF